MTSPVRVPRILIIADPLSVHTERWVQQIRVLGWDVHLFCFQYGDGNQHIEVKMKSVRAVGGKFPGVMVHHQLSQLAFQLVNSEQPKTELITCGEELAQVISSIQPDVIHCISLIPAGRLALEAKKILSQKFPPWIATIMGSDITHYRKTPSGSQTLREVLGAADYCWAECPRDYTDATFFGFQGEFLPLVPSAGGLDLEYCRTASRRPPSKRPWVLLKGYQNVPLGTGRALVGLRALEANAKDLKKYRIGIYSSSPEVSTEAGEIVKRTGLEIFGLPRVDHRQQLLRHANARISLGLSMSDGISTSLLEAMAMGSFPIQSNTCCGEHWIKSGETGSLVPPEDVSKIAEWIQIALQNDDLVDQAAIYNFGVIEDKMNPVKLERLIQESYSKILQN